MKIEIEVPDYIEDGSISEEIKARIASGLLREIKRDTISEIKKGLTAKIQETCDVIVKDALAERFPLTNEFGEKKSDPVTLRELIIKESTKRLDAKVDANTGKGVSYNKPSCTAVEWMVKKAVQDVIIEEVGKIQDKIKTEAYTAMKTFLESQQ